MRHRPEHRAVLVVLILAARRRLLAGASRSRISAPPGRPAFTLTPEQREKVEIAPLAPETFRRGIVTTGTVAFDADQSTQVLAPISGPVSRLLVSVGAAVKAGAPLAAVASPDFAAAVSRLPQVPWPRRRTPVAIADLDAEALQERRHRAPGHGAGRDRRRGGRVGPRRRAPAAPRPSGSTSRRSTTSARDGPSRQQRASSARPSTARWSRSSITPGQLLQAGATPCFTVADLSTVWVMANIFESDLPFVAWAIPPRSRPASPPSRFPERSTTSRPWWIPTTRAIAVRIVARQPRATSSRGTSTSGSRSTPAGVDSGPPRCPSRRCCATTQNLPFVYVRRRQRRLRAPPRDRWARGSATATRSSRGLEAGDRVVVEGGLFMQFAESQ